MLNQQLCEGLGSASSVVRTSTMYLSVMRMSEENKGNMVKSIWTQYPAKLLGWDDVDKKAPPLVKENTSWITHNLRTNPAQKKGSAARRTIDVSCFRTGPGLPRTAFAINLKELVRSGYDPFLSIAEQAPSGILRDD